MYQGKDPTEVDQKVGLSRRQHNETTECMPCFGQRGSDLLVALAGYVLLLPFDGPAEIRALAG
jgi:hypothetical protein